MKNIKTPTDGPLWPWLLGTIVIVSIIIYFITSTVTPQEEKAVETSFQRNKALSSFALQHPPPAWAG